MGRFEARMLLALGALAFAALIWTFLRPGPQWEYLVVAPSDDAIARELAKRGADGWELVTARRVVDDPANVNSSTRYEMIFKRATRFEDIRPVVGL